MSEILIAVDGPAGSGKSTVAKAVAIEMGFKYIDSGAIYRAVTLHLLRKFNEIPSTVNVGELLDEMNLSQRFFSDGSSKTYSGGADVSEDIRSELVVKNIGRVSDNPEIRNGVNVLLRSWSLTESIIMDGRDIGTVVFPEADVKFYLDASADVRARRRCGEYVNKGVSADFEKIKEQILIRDNQDMSRAVGALKRAADAVYIDTSDMSREDVTAKMVHIIKEKIENTFDKN
jgi:CMP/dCMP kinase